MNWFRIFFKQYGDGPGEKAIATVEFQTKNIKMAYNKAEKMGKKKKYKIAMIAEVAFSGLHKEHL